MAVHPRAPVTQRLTGGPVRRVFLRANANLGPKASHPDPKYVADDTYHDDDEEAEDNEGATGTIRVVMDTDAGKCYVLMPGLGLDEGTFGILTE